MGLQVKSGPSHRYDRQDGTFTVSVSQDDARYWLAANYPVLLVYLHDGENALYFRHVQAAFGDEQSLARCTSLVFGEADRAEGRMAEYVRELARVTPSILNRFRVLSEPAVLTVGSERTALGPVSSAKETLSFERFRVSDTYNLWDLFPTYHHVLGYSEDERWVCELRVPDEGPRGALTAEVAFVDLAAHASIDVPLFITEENTIGTMTAVDRAEYGAKIDHLDRLAELLKIRPARMLHDRYDAFQTEARQQVRLSFGEEEFVLQIGAHEGRDTLALSAARYQPPRTAHLLIERAPFAFLFVREDNFPRTADELMPMEKPQRFEYVAGVAASQGGGRLTVAVMTVDTHLCWGTRAVHLVHLGMEELRRTCADALRT